jgi:molybdopterin molybdotransferase
LPISQRIPAGVAPQPLKPGSAARIFTGGILPQGADTVVIQEDCTPDGEQVVLPGDVIAKITAGANVRARGQDMQQGMRVMAQGQRLGPAQLGVLAATGIAQVPVFRRLRIAIVSTGSELVEPGEVLQTGQIYNSNRATLQGLLQRMGCEVVMAVSVPDDRQATIDCLAAAAVAADVVITCGGVSVGEEDHVKPAIEQLGKLDIWKLAIKPGKPVAYGHVRGVPLFGLPGNPVSVFVTFLILVRPCLMLMAGQQWREPIPRRIAAAFSRSPNKTRQEYLRVRIEQDAAGNEQLREFSTQDSSILTSIAWANALAVIPVGTRIDEGDLLDTLAFEHLLY